MFSKFLIFEIVPNTIQTLVYHRKKIVTKAKKKTKLRGKGSFWGYKKRQYIARYSRNLFEDLKTDQPEWQKSFGLLQPLHIKQIVNKLEWEDIRAHKLSKLNRVLLWIFRLRKAAKLSDLALLFGVSSSTCHYVFESITDQFIKKFKSQIQIPFEKNQSILQEILITRGELLPQHIYALDGKHFKRYGGAAHDFSFKLKKKARNGLLLVNRATGKIDYMSINHTGTTHDISAWENSSLMQNEFVKNAFFDNYTIIADLGFQSKAAIGIYTPGYNENSDGWKKLTEKQRQASELLRKAQKNIENTFAALFFNSFKLCEQVFGNDKNSTKQAKIIHASVLLHNLTIEWTNRSIFDDEYQRIQTQIDNFV